MEAAQALSSSLADKPGVVATRAELLNKAGKKNEAVALLRSVQVQPDDNALRVAAQRLKFDDIDGCKEAIAIYPGNEPEDVAKKAVLAAFYDADEAEELVNQLPQDLVPQVDEEMTQEDVDKLLEAGVPKAWRTSRRRTEFGCAGQDAETGRSEGQEAGGVLSAEEAPEAYLAKLQSEGKYDPKNPKPPDPGPGSRRARSYNSAAAKQGQVHGGPGRRHQRQGREARREVARRRAQGQGRKGQGRARPRRSRRAVREEEADGEPQEAAGERHTRLASRGAGP